MYSEDKDKQVPQEEQEPLKKETVTEATDKEETDTEATETKETEPKEKKKKRDKKQEKIDALELEVSELRDKFLRNEAELQNFKRRSNEERIRERKYANAEFAKAILPMIDNFDLAFEKEKENNQIKDALKGFDMIYKNLKTTLEEQGLKEIEALGKPFDPNYHQAVMTEENEDVEAGTVIEVYQKGYMFKERLLRPAMVKVSE